MRPLPLQLCHFYIWWLRVIVYRNSFSLLKDSYAIQEPMENLQTEILYITMIYKQQNDNYDEYFRVKTLKGNPKWLPEARGSLSRKVNISLLNICNHTHTHTKKIQFVGTPKNELLRDPWADFLHFGGKYSAGSSIESDLFF